MAEFLPNLDDGESWLPSDILLNDVAANHRRGVIIPRCFSPLDELSRSFSALTLLPPRPSNDCSPPTLCLPQNHCQRTQHGTVISSSAAGLFRSAMMSSGTVHDKCSRRNALSPVAPKLLYDEYLLLWQAHMHQVEAGGCTEAQAIVLPNRVQNQLGIHYHGRGAFRREYAGTGTGVFLPRIAQYTPASDFRRKQGMRNRLDIEISQQMNSITRVGAVTKQEKQCHLELPPEMTLPHEWSY